MALAPDGEYVPALHQCNSCGLCLKVCPFASLEEAVLGKAPLGPVLRAFVGYSLVPGERERGSSGGLATRLLRSLLERGLVDGVVAAVPTGRADRLFEPTILRSSEEIEQAAGSRYYPIEFSQVLRDIRRADGRYALIGVPCVIRALRLAQQQCPWVAERLRYLFGLVCGRGVSAHYTAALAYLSGVREPALTMANYRSKQGTEKASDYQFIATGKDGVRGRPLPFSRGPNEIWNSDLLTLDGCFACTDLFPAKADAMFMDAWLPAYMSDPGGTSIVVISSSEVASVVQEEAAHGRVALSPMDEVEVLASKSGALARKEQIGDVVHSRIPAFPLRRLELWHRRLRARLCKQMLRDQGRGRALGLRALCAYVGLLRFRSSLRRPAARARSILVRPIKKALQLLCLKRGEVCTK